ncbi:hypothetical protein EDC44_13110 [Cricetibacter osteomyelitidis]|uniref:Cof subfamily protein (Haloacid dehalogenase superfamily)/HAD superfamily hydrolase (TIGR01484 family) n=1 Tax=Cricetibacter osteomyelitidis TaxID=1521931 RepID=A0A4R2SSR7_9PAST|nr:Cof-type HAD-IIB family hydrolase [Cricetibacter osteomyelitidis]TCP91304.1 hypothetical protein EDC44_13110 [Cricetibacter osteomyelitidis]
MTVPNYRDQIKIVFFDIDDTLYLKHEDFIPDSVQTIFRKLKQNGIIPAIATGRTKASFPVKLKPILEQENVETFVTMNGQYATHQGKVVKYYPLQKQDLNRVIHFFKQHNIEYAFISNEAVIVSDITPELKFALDPITTDYYPDPNYAEQNEVCQLLAFYAEDKDQFVQDADIYANLRTVRWHEYSVDIFDKQGSKARGIQNMLDHLGLDWHNTMAFGDGLNDIEMLTQAGVGVAMGNGHADLKAVADYVTDSVAENGIYNFLVKAGLID